MAEFTAEAAAALTFLIGYLAIFAWMLYAYLTHRIKWRSKWSLLFSHVTIRLASQGCGIGFGVVGFSNPDLFLAYLILGAEGYFSLPSAKDSDPPPANAAPRYTGIAWLFLLPFSLLARISRLFYNPDNPMVTFNTVLILANAATITGGSYLSAADTSPAEIDSSATQRRLRVAKIARTAGQSAFLACNMVLLGIILVTMRNNRREGDARRKSGTVHSTLTLLLMAWFPLIVRGVFGVLQAAVFDVTENYTNSGFTSRFNAIENLLGVFPEWLGVSLCVILNLTYLTSRQDPSKSDPVDEEASGVELT
ncbi:hypothetical protein C8J57DRAFT_1342785 [Mycena rebaudengoi]|nr:hypothetical protein C8J57DRAFT_1342785 [Mycena rebaudengoi]